jgi:DNA polymerase-3 subunit alpha
MAGVLLKKQEKMSQKGNKYAFLQLSDPTGIFEVTLFSEMLASAREHLEPGTALLIGVEAEQREDQIRYTATSIKPLDEALEGKIRSIDIHLDKSEPVHKIKEFLDIEGKGHAHINLHVKIDGQRVVQLRLPGRWSLSAQARNIIRTQEGVQEISEG